MRIPILVVVVLLVSFSLALAQTEKSLAVNTLYPSPYGSYNELQLYPHSSPRTACSEKALGTIYYDNSLNKLRVCTQTVNGYEYVTFGPQQVAIIKEDVIDGGLVDM